MAPLAGGSFPLIYPQAGQPLHEVLRSAKTLEFDGLGASLDTVCGCNALANRVAYRDNCQTIRLRPVSTADVETKRRKMIDRFATQVRLPAAAILVVWLVCPAAAAADEQPDFTGIWRSYPGARTQWPADPAHTEEARTKIDAYRSLIEGTGATPGGFCVGTGMPGSMLGSGGYPMEIIQRPEQVTIIYEAHTALRRVYLDDREVDPNDLIPTRNGFSTGRWDGDTLVVSTTSLKEAVDQRSAHSDEAEIVERYRLGEDDDGNRLLIAELTLTDPRFYVEPVTVTKTWVAAAPDARMLLYECTEPDWEDYLEDLRTRAEARNDGE